MSTTTVTPARRTKAPLDRETAAERLLASSAKRSYDPVVDIDWDAPIPDHLYGMPPEWCSLYGTPTWDGLTEEQRVTLSRHEAASIATMGIWFEVILMHMVLRDVYDRDPDTSHVQWQLTEIADECRHSVMFARMSAKYGAAGYGPSRRAQFLGRFFKTVAKDSAAYAGILIAEEVLDIVQRDTIDDERVTPLSRATAQIHVVEEARHMRFARDEIARSARGINPLVRLRYQAMLGNTALVMARNLVNKRVYASVGIDPDEGASIARTNPHYREKLRTSAAGLTSFLTEVGLIGPVSRGLWKRSGLL